LSLIWQITDVDVDPHAAGGRWHAVFEGIAGDFADGEHKVFAPGGDQSGAGSVTADDLAQWARWEGWSRM
jgi:hypothetical protein